MEWSIFEHMLGSHFVLSVYPEYTDKCKEGKEGAPRERTEPRRLPASGGKKGARFPPGMEHSTRLPPCQGEG